MTWLEGGWSLEGLSDLPSGRQRASSERNPPEKGEGLMRRLRWAVLGVLLALAGWGGHLSGSLLPCCPAGLAKAQICCCLPVPSAPGSPCCPPQKGSGPTCSEQAEGFPPAGVCQCWPTEKYLTTFSMLRFWPPQVAVWNATGPHLLLERFSSGLNGLCFQMPPPLRPRLQSLYCIWRK
jgi:hypothetical protein